MKKTSKSNIVLVMLILFLMLYLQNISIMIEEVLDYTKLFYTKLFPVSFPFFILSSLLIEYGLVDKLSILFPYSSQRIYIFLISLLSGFPSGSKYTKELYLKKEITKEEGNNLLQFSHFPNPLFVLGTVNIVLQDIHLCIKLYLSIIFSNVVLLILQKRKKEKKIIPIKKQQSFPQILSSSITSSIQTILLIYGTSLIFYLISVLITKTFPLPTSIYVIISGLLDLTKGVFVTTLFHNKLKRAYYILFFISFGGLSIHMQVKSILMDTSLSYKSFFKGRLLGTILSILFFTLILICKLP